MKRIETEALVIGAGPGGYPCGIRLGQLGVKTVVVERRWWGGVCLNVGCIPSKALITAAKTWEGIGKAKEMGIHVEGARLAMPELIAWKEKVVKRLSGGVQTLLKGNKAEIVDGQARFVSPNEVEVDPGGGGEVVRIAFRHAVIATGSRPIEIGAFPFDERDVLSSTGALDLKEVPKRLVVIGGGYIGLEMGMMYAKLGAAVTVVEAMDQVLPGFDPEVVDVVVKHMRRDKIKTLLGARAQGFERRDGELVVRVEAGGKTEEIACDKVLVTVGRRPVTEGLDLDKAGLQVDAKGFLAVDEQCRTKVPHIFAIGDVAGEPMLAHKATRQGEVAAEVIAGRNAACDYRTVPAVVFTDPEIATAGWTQAEAEARGHEVVVGKLPFSAVGRALTQMETDGFVKVIADKADHQVLGIAIVGPHASDLISEATLAIEMSAFLEDVSLTIHPHPTLGEAMMEAANATLGHAIHIINKAPAAH
ncbi:dihydrolipoyl dehydrogenase [Myxococcota bacterium]|nr:dihydrolipoyl dehydrogenase [Myxococcota bacterium]